MSRICSITGKRPKVGGRIIHKGVSKKAGGIGLQLVKNNKEHFGPIYSVFALNCLVVKLRDSGYPLKRLKLENSKSIVPVFPCPSDWAFPFKMSRKLPFGILTLPLTR